MIVAITLVAPSTLNDLAPQSLLQVQTKGVPTRHEPPLLKRSIPLESGTFENRELEPEKITRPSDSITQPIARSQASATAKLTGTVYAQTGERVPKETVKLFSPSLGKAYFAKTKSSGYFEFSAVVPADDYKLWINPIGMYKRYKLPSLSISEAQEPLMIALETLENAVLVGRVINQQGEPVSGLRLKLTSATKSKWQQVINTDPVGRFVANHVPDGGLIFSTTIDQILLSSGHQFQHDVSNEITLVLDAGAFELSGTIFDIYNDPMPGANVIVSWEHNEGEIHTSTYRRTTSLSDGTFLVAGLGAGKHDVVISDGGTGASHRQQIHLDSYYTDLTVVLNDSRLRQ